MGNLSLFIYMFKIEFSRWTLMTEAKMDEMKSRKKYSHPHAFQKQGQIEILSPLHLASQCFLQSGQKESPLL